jgi:phosphatidate cytidylyltransferase
LPARLATAAAGIPLLLLVIWVGGPLFTAVVAIFLGLGAFELARAAGLHARDPDAIAGMAAAAAMAPAAHLESDARVGILSALVVVTLAILVLRAEVDRGFARWGAVLGAVAYAGILGSHLVLLRRLEDGRGWVLLLLFTVFATDTGAYAVGRLFGRRKLAPRVSPAKTVEGALGGLVAAAVVCLVLNEALGLGQRPLGLLALGAAIGVAGQIGDLGESLLKRSLGVKDMGRIFPGHGGVLDRLDSILFAAPLLYYIVEYVLDPK